MNVREALDIIQSDMKLWDAAESKDLGNGRVEKTLHLPWGLGEVVVILEGMTDAGKRRQAVEGYGKYIRGLVDEQTDDEAITARAQAAAARSEPKDSGDSDRKHPDNGLCNTTSEAETVQGTSKTHPVDAEDTPDFGTTLVARESALLARLGAAKATIAKWEQELTGIEAALKAMGYTR